MKTFKRRGGKLWLCGLAAVALLGGYTYWAWWRPLPTLNPTTATGQLQTPATTPRLDWPADGQSAVGIAGSQIMVTHGSQTPAPTASTAKLITALVVLRAKPLKPGSPGPTITLGPNDVAIYNAYAAQDGSVVRVVAGEQISEYQMLETLLLPSANNMADSLATWAFGSLEAYGLAANSYLSQLGLVHTHVGTDASGFAPSTTSTAHDLVRLGELAMQNPVLAPIVGQATASGIPVAGNIKNVNSLLGTSGIIGVKTGNTSQAGGVFVGAARASVNGKPVTVVTALVGAPSLVDAMKDSLPLLQSAQANFHSVPVIRAGSVAGQYRLPWGGRVTAKVSKSLSLEAWNGNSISSAVQLQSIAASARPGQTVGYLNVEALALSDQQSIPIKLQSAPTKPPLTWRLLHP